MPPCLTRYPSSGLATNARTRPRRSPEFAAGSLIGHGREIPFPGVIHALEPSDLRILPRP